MKSLIILAQESVRVLPAPPVFYGLFAFGVLVFLLFIVLRLGRD